MSEIGFQIRRKQSKSSFEISDAISIYETLHKGADDKKDPKKDALSFADDIISHFSQRPESSRALNRQKSLLLPSVS